MGGDDVGWDVGEVVLRSSPMAHIISADQRGQVCHQCWNRFEEGEGQSCQCGLVFFCGDKCKAEGQLDHKGECGVEGLLDLPDKLLLLLRIWLKLQEAPQEEEGFGRHRSWSDLEDHREEVEEEVGHLLDILHRQLVATVGEEVGTRPIECFATCSFSVCTRPGHLRPDLGSHANEQLQFEVRREIIFWLLPHYCAGPTG